MAQSLYFIASFSSGLLSQQWYECTSTALMTVQRKLVLRDSIRIRRTLSSPHIVYPSIDTPPHSIHVPMHRLRPPPQPTLQQPRSLVHRPPRSLHLTHCNHLVLWNHRAFRNRHDVPASRPPMSTRLSSGFPGRPWLPLAGRYTRERKQGGDG